MGVEFVFLEGDGLAQRLTLGLGRRGGVTAGGHVALDLLVVDAAVHPQRLEDRAEFADRLVGAGDDLAGDGRAFGAVAVQKFRGGLALDDGGEFPGEVEPVLDRGVGAKPVRRRVPVRRVAHDEGAARLHVGGEAVVHRPGVGAQKLDLQVRIADQLARDLGGKGGIDHGGRLGDVIAPDDQPFVPGPHHTDKAHADPAHIRAGLHDPVKDRGTVGDIFGQVGTEQDVHRPADAHLAFEGQAKMFGDQAVAAISADEVLGPHRQLLAGEAVAAGGGHAVRVLDVADVFGRHPALRAAAAGRGEEDRLHEGLGQVVHFARAGAEVAGFRLGRGAPGLHPAQLLTGEAFAEDVVAHQLLMGGVQHRLGLDLGAKVAQHLHRALVGDMGAGGVGQPAVAVDDQDIDPVGGQQRGGGRAGRAGADDKNVGGDVSHHWSPLKLMPERRR